MKTIPPKMMGTNQMRMGSMPMRLEKRMNMSIAKGNGGISGRMDAIRRRMR